MVSKNDIEMLNQNDIKLELQLSEKKQMDTEITMNNVQ